MAFFVDFEIIFRAIVMVANADLKYGFQTDSNSDLTKNFGSGLKSGFQIQIRN
jgi:hypothetical protein